MKKFFLLISINLIITACLNYNQACAEYLIDNQPSEPISTQPASPSMLICCEIPPRPFQRSTDLANEFTSTNLDIDPRYTSRLRWMETERNCLDGTGRYNETGYVISTPLCGAYCYNAPSLDICNNCCDMVYLPQSPIYSNACRTICGLILGNPLLPLVPINQESSNTQTIIAPVSSPQPCIFNTDCQTGFTCINNQCNY